MNLFLMLLAAATGGVLYFGSPKRAAREPFCFTGPLGMECFSRPLSQENAQNLVNMFKAAPSAERVRVAAILDEDGFGKLAGDLR